MEEIDFRPLTALVVSRLIESLPLDSKLSDRVTSLFRKAWVAFPQQHDRLIVYVRREDVWQMPEIYDYAREAIIPKDRASVRTWTPFVPMSVPASATQTAKPSVSLLVDVASKLGKLDELASEIASTRKKQPAWTAGDALLAMVLCRAGRYDEAEALVQTLLETIKKTRSRRQVRTCFMLTPPSLRGWNKTLVPAGWRLKSIRTR